MDNVGSNGPQPNMGNEPIPLESTPAKISPPEAKPANGPAPVSRAPLNLGGGVTAAVPAPAAPAVTPATAPGPVKPAAPAPAAAAPRPMPPRPVPTVGTADRVTGCKTFFTKLHPGAIDFLDEQITQWLKDNPGVVIKMTNTATGEVQGKKTEGNILMTVWYHGVATKSLTHMG